MSYRYNNAFVKPGLNTLVSPPANVTYELWGWGNSGYGQLGLGNTTNYSSPKHVGSLTNWLKIGGGNYFVSAIKTDGTLWTWGQNSNGQLGLGNTTYYSSPKQVGLLTNWSYISGAGVTYFNGAIKTDGTLWAWGYNGTGSLGLGDTINRSSPTQVGALTNWAAISCGSIHALATKTDGTLWAWGSNYFGQLGINTHYNNYSSPKQVGSLTDWAKVAGGNDFSAAIKTDGTLWTWGRGQYGQLGLGFSGYRSSPNQVGALTNWLSVSCSTYAMIAIKTDGSLWTWGSGTNGVLGLGNTTSYSSPKQIGALTTWTKSACGRYFAGALRSDGTLWAWGSGGSGQIGIGNTTYYSSPKQVGSETTWRNINMGSASTIALKV